MRGNVTRVRAGGEGRGGSEVVRGVGKVGAVTPAGPRPQKRLLPTRDARGDFVTVALCCGR